VIGGGGGGGRWSSFRCTGDETSFGRGSGQRILGSAGPEPKEVVVIVVLGEVPVQEVLQYLGRHLPVAFFAVVVGLVRRDLDRGAPPLRPQGGHLRHPREGRMASPLVGHVHAVVHVDGLALGERPVVVQCEGPVLADQGTLLADVRWAAGTSTAVGRRCRDEVVELVEDAATLGAHPPAVLKRPADDDAADLLAGGHLLQTGEGVRRRRRRRRSRRCRGGARRSLPREEDGIEGAGGRRAGAAAAGMRGDGDADAIPADVQGHDGARSEGGLPVHEGRHPGRSNQVAAQLRWRSRHDGRFVLLSLISLAREMMIRRY
jgi:hypothetical protein